MAIRVALAAACLIASVTAQAVGYAAPSSRHRKEKASQIANIPSCAGPNSTPSRAPDRTKTHSVTLSWNASNPRSNTPRDAIRGYYVYRSLSSHTYTEISRLNALPLAGTRCIDSTVELNGTYFYVVKAVSVGGTRSDFSAQVSVVIPSH